MSSQSSIPEIARRLGLPQEKVPALTQALTHKSLVPDAPLTSNERLEFLGDSVLGLVINERLCDLFPDRREGELAKAKALLVCKPVLAAAAIRLGLPPLIRLGRAEEAMGGRERSSIAADAFEAVIAVIYRERGYEAARDFILESLAPEIAQVTANCDWRDPKTILQELRQAARLSPPVYQTTHEDGLPHNRTFRVNVVLDNVVAGTGNGKSKREAQQAAAEAALARQQS